MNAKQRQSPKNYNDDDEEENYEQDQDQYDMQYEEDVQPKQQQQVQQQHNNSDDDNGFYSDRGGNSQLGSAVRGNQSSKKDLNIKINNNNHLTSKQANITHLDQQMNSTATFEQQQLQQKHQMRMSVDQGKLKNAKQQPIKAQPMQQLQQASDPYSVEQMRDINFKLKEELSSLIERLEIALNKFKDRKEKDKQRYGINPQYQNQSQLPDDLLQKEKELRNAHSRSTNVKKEILKIRRKLETNVDINLITELENEIKNKEQLLAKLEDQNNQIKKVGFQQQRAMQDLNKEEELQQQLSHTNMQIRQVKLDTRQIQEQYKEIDKSIQEEHKIIYDLEERYRKINALIAIKKRKNPNAQDQPADPDDLLTEEELESQIKALEDIKLEREQKAKRQIADLDRQLTTQKEEQEINEIKLKDKDQQLKNAELKIKEMKRQIQVIQQNTKQAAANALENQQKEQQQNQNMEIQEGAGNFSHFNKVRKAGQVTKKLQ
eukprot:403370257